MASEEHAEELEALRSIFDGDATFKILSETSVQAMIGEEGSPDSFLLQLDWPDTYPMESGPTVVLDLFYNTKLLAETKEAIRAVVSSEAESLLGMGMTFSLIEVLKERRTELLSASLAAASAAVSAPSAGAQAANEERKPVEKKEQLTKSQKRRMWDRGGEDRERGWDWVCLIRHLSQTGGQG